MAKLVGHVPYLWKRIGLEVILLQKFEGVLAQQLEGDAHVAVEIEPVRHQDTQARPTEEKEQRGSGNPAAKEAELPRPSLPPHQILWGCL